MPRDPELVPCQIFQEMDDLFHGISGLFVSLIFYTSFSFLTMSTTQPCELEESQATLLSTLHNTSACKREWGQGKTPWISESCPFRPPSFPRSVPWPCSVLSVLGPPCSLVFNFCQLPGLDQVVCLIHSVNSPERQLVSVREQRHKFQKLQVRHLQKLVISHSEKD